MEQKRMNLAFRQYLLISLLNCSCDVDHVNVLQLTSDHFCRRGEFRNLRLAAQKCSVDVGATDHEVAQSDRAQLTCAVHDRCAPAATFSPELA